MISDGRWFNWGVIAPGNIAQKFGQALSAVPGARLAGVASRSPERGRAFAARFGEADSPPRVHDSYAWLLADNAIDAVYIASPHSFHFEQAQAALEAGKPVLCEKPLTVNAEQTQMLMNLAEEKDLFLMEALWSRFLPAWRQVRHWLDDERIGPLHSLRSEFCVRIDRDDSGRLLNPNLAGGNMLDMGVYCVAMSRFVTGCDPDRVQASVYLGPTGVDERTAAVLEYGAIASQLTGSFLAERDNDFLIEGERGRIRVAGPFWASERAELTLWSEPGSPRHETFEQPHRANGFEYEIQAAMAAIRAGEKECPDNPWAATLGTARVMDQILLGNNEPGIRG